MPTMLPTSLASLVYGLLLVAPVITQARELDKWRKPWTPPDPLTPSTINSKLSTNLAVSGYATIPDILPDCLPNSVSVVEMNALLAAKGENFVLSLCPSTTYQLETTLILTAAGQEVSTLGYPTDDTRAMLVVAGSKNLETGMSTAIYAACAACSDIKIRNIQIDGQRNGMDPINNGAAIEMGGQVSGQVLEYTRSFDPRGWSCAHIAEGALDCKNATIRFNDIGPCGHDAPYSAWADGISHACTGSLVEGNTIVDPTDGGIVVFGATGSTIRNNTISVQNSTALGGINLVDYAPWNGMYNGTIVENNNIYGGFAGSYGDDQHGPSDTGAIIKIGIGIGPRVWFGAGSAELQFAEGGTVRNNQLSGAFGWAVAVANAKDFTVEGNTLLGNTSFIGERSLNCTGGVEEQGPITLGVPFLVQSNTTFTTSLQDDFTDGNVIFLTCLSPPDKSSNEWPYGSSLGSIDYAPPPSVDWGSSTTDSPSATDSSSAASSPSTSSPSADNTSAALPIHLSSSTSWIVLSLLATVALHLNLS